MLPPLKKGDTSETELGIVFSFFSSCRQGEPAESLFVVISGRCKLLHYSPRLRQLAAEEDVGRGDSMGAVGDNHIAALHNMT